MANNLVIRPANNDNPIPPNTYQFGVSATNGNTVENWFDNNTFIGLANGSYIWAVRNKTTLALVRTGFSLLYDVDIPALASLNNVIGQNGDPVNLQINTMGQTIFPIANGELRRRLFLNGTLQVVGIDYTIDSEKVTWISPTIVLDPAKNKLYLSF